MRTTDYSAYVGSRGPEMGVKLFELGLLVREMLVLAFGLIAEAWRAKVVAEEVGFCVLSGWVVTF